MKKEGRKKVIDRIPVVQHFQLRDAFFSVFLHFSSGKQQKSGCNVFVLFCLSYPTKLAYIYYISISISGKDETFIPRQKNPNDEENTTPQPNFGFLYFFCCYFTTSSITFIFSTFFFVTATFNEKKETILKRFDRRRNNPS